MAPLFSKSFLFPSVHVKNYRDLVAAAMLINKTGESSHSNKINRAPDAPFQEDMPTGWYTKRNMRKPGK